MSKIWSLPEEYGENIMTMLVQNPQTLFVYWELDQANWQSITSAVYLRLYQLQDAAFESKILLQEIILPPFSNKWYFDPVQSESFYVAEIGYQEEQDFIAVLRSNVAATPACPVQVFNPQMLTPSEASGKDDRPKLTEVPIKPIEELNQPLEKIIQEMPFYLGIQLEDF